jgi:serine/threonine-protein kinase
MGAVYLARDTRFTTKKWALKEMSDAALTDPAERAAAQAQFAQEAEMLANLDHPGLPKVTDHFTEGGRHYLVMDFVEGETLADRLAACGKLPEAEARRIAAQLCDVLEYLHRRTPPIVFRDLKPGNIMLQPDGRVRLIDFGIARVFKPGKSGDTLQMGSPGYAAPEQYGRGQSDARTDVYALGATLHQMLTGRDPADAPFNFPTTRSLNAQVPEALDRVVMKALKMEPAQRWQTVGELRKVLAAPPTPPPVAPRPAPATPPTPRAVVTPLPAPSVQQNVNVVVNPPPQVVVVNPPQAAPSPAKPNAGFLRRVGLFLYALVTVGLGVLLATPWVTGRLTSLNGHIGSAILFGVALLAYLCTHRPLAVPLTFGVAWLAAIFLFPASLFTWDYLGPRLLIAAAAVEIGLLLSLWRTRNLFWLAALPVAGAFVLEAPMWQQRGLELSLGIISAANPWLDAGLLYAYLFGAVLIASVVSVFFLVITCRDTYR